MASPQAPGKPKPTTIGTADEAIEQDELEQAEHLGPPIRDDAEPSAKPPPAATSEPEPRGRPADLDEE